MAKIFARSILLLSVVTTALAFFQHGIVSRDQHQLEGDMANIVRNVDGVTVALKAINSDSGLPNLMEVQNTLYSTKQSLIVANHHMQGAPSVSPAMEETFLASMEKAKDIMAPGLDDFRSKATQMNKIYSGSVTEGCNILEDLNGQFKTLASSVEHLKPVNRDKLAAARDDIHKMLSETTDNPPCAGK
ncbi:hypothetical protein B0H19DRAFT_1277008 [Mycena capillaripes]|nr:hypothetical protein B0H19DRAFT_1277008 [Mycena capillaripes]